MGQGHCISDQTQSASVVTKWNNEDLMYSGFEITFMLSQARIYSERKSFIHLENLWLEVTVNFLLVIFLPFFPLI